MSPDDEKNIYQKDSDEKFNAITKAEKKGTVDDTGKDNVKDAEENPSGNWKNNVTGTGGGGRGKNTSSTTSNKGIGNTATSNTGPTKSNVKYSFIKKRGPLLAIILTVFGGGVGIVGLITPSIVLVQIKEVLVGKFDTQLTSMDARGTRLYHYKTNPTTGHCGSVINILCKYSTMSKKQVENFKKAGIKVDYDNKTLSGRIKPKNFVFDDEIIPAKNFNNTVKKNSNFRAATHLAYNPKFAGFADAIWKKATGLLGISKKATDIEGKTEKERLKKVQDQTKNPAQLDPAVAEHWDYGKDKPGGGTYSNAEVEAHNLAADEANKALRELSDLAKAEEKSGIKAAPKVLAKFSGIITKVINVFKITGWLDNACSVFTVMQAVGYAAKTVRVLQLARYAMIFLNVADQIKAGDAKAEDVAYLGKIVTTDIAPSLKNPLMGSGTATNSFGYRFAAYGKGGNMSDTATQFLAGGGLAGSLIGITALINSTLYNKPRQTCKILGNYIVSIASLLIGIVSFFIPGVGEFRVGQTILQVVGAVGLAFALAYAPALLQDIVAGVLVDDTTAGAAAGEAIASGTSGIMSTTAKAGGNAPLTPPQAVAYSNLTNSILAQYAEEDRATHSPFDASNSNTFLGMIVAKLTPYASNMSSTSGAFSSIFSMATGSFALLAPQNAMAASESDYKMCQDFDYNDLVGDGSGKKLATDPYCNVTYGIPPEALEANPIEVAQTLIDSGEIDEITGDPITDSNYGGFLKDCIDREKPLGDASDGGTPGVECMFGEDYKGTPNNNYYIHYIDQRVQAGLDGEEETTTGTTTPTGDTPSSGDAQQLATEILANNKIDLSPFGASPKDDVEAAANGKVGTAGVMTDARILKLIATIGQNHSVQVTAIQSRGQGHSVNSPHYLGKAVDFDRLDGDPAAGRDAASIKIIKIAETVWSAGRFGQDGCPGSTAPKPNGWITFPDGCTHLHMDVSGV